MGRGSAGRGGRNRKKRSVALFLAAVLLTAGVLVCKGQATGGLLPWQRPEEQEKSAAILAAEPVGTDESRDTQKSGSSDQTDDDVMLSASERTKKSDETYVPEEDRQALLCMGEEPGTMYITWKGDAKGPKYLRISDDKYTLPTVVPLRAQRTRILKGDYYRYKVKLSGLAEGRLYYYEIGDGTAFDSPRFFYAPDDGGETVFAYLGDPQFDKLLRDYETWRDLVWGMYKTNQNVEFAVAGGDLVNVPTRESHWNGFLDNCTLFGMIPLMTIPGNHEGVTSNVTYKKLFNHIGNGPMNEAFYFFDYGHCRFVMLDSSFLTKARQKTMGQALWSVREKEIENWLQAALAESDKPWNIVVTHHPIYGMHDIFTVSPEIREHWLPIMEEEGVDLVLCGHQHAYMRTRKIDGILHVMGNSGGKRSNFYRGFNRPDYAESVYAAGANYQIVRATKTSLELTSYDQSNSVIDSVRLRKSPWPRF